MTKSLDVARYAYVFCHVHSKKYSALLVQLFTKRCTRDISSEDYITYLALDENRVVGFIGLKKKLVDNYMILDMMHVSSQCRGKGIGRQLFDLGKEEAKKAGAKELYISACSSEETIAFYRATGSELTKNPIKEMAEEEPYDLQMTCPV